MKIKELYNGVEDMPILNYTYFVLYYQLFRSTDVAMRGSVHNIINEMLAISVSKEDVPQKLANFASNLSDGWERLVEGVPYIFKCFDCMIKDNDISSIIDSEIFYGKKFGFDYLLIVSIVNDFYEKMQSELIRYFGDTKIFYEVIQDMRKDFSELSKKLLLIDPNNDNDIERLIIDLSAEKVNENRYELFKDLEMEYKKQYVGMFARLGLDDYEKQKKTTTLSYYAKIVEIQRQETQKQS